MVLLLAECEGQQKKACTNSSRYSHTSMLMQSSTVVNRRFDPELGDFECNGDITSATFGANHVHSGGTASLWGCALVCRIEDSS